MVDEVTRRAMDEKSGRIVMGAMGAVAGMLVLGPLFPLGFAAGVAALVGAGLGGAVSYGVTAVIAESIKAAGKRHSAERVAQKQRDARKERRMEVLANMSHAPQLAVPEVVAARAEAVAQNEQKETQRAKREALIDKPRAAAQDNDGPARPARKLAPGLAPAP